MEHELIGNPEMDYLFEEDLTKQSQEYLSLKELYENTVGENCIPQRGQVINGIYSHSSDEYHVFTIPGGKDDIRVDNKPGENKYVTSFDEGMELEVIITSSEKSMLKGSISYLYEKMAHKTLQGLEKGKPVKVNVLESNPAGYTVEILHGRVHLPGFMPNTLAGINKLPDPNSIVGETFEVMIESYAEQEGTYIVSRRRYLKTLISTEIEKLNREESYIGHVTGTTPFGVFVEFNQCLTGMIHKANLNPDWQDKISEIKPGFEIEFFVKDVIKDKRNQKIILTQILRDSLWDSIEIDDIIEGTVKSIKAFGILVNLDDETIGLIPTRDKGNRKYEDGKKIKVVVSNVDKSSRKIYLKPFSNRKKVEVESED